MDASVLAHGFYGAIAAAAVLDNDFKARVGLGQDAVKGLIQFGAGVQAYYDNAEFHMLLLLRYNISAVENRARNAARSHSVAERSGT